MFFFSFSVSEAPNKGQSLEIKVDPRYVIASKGSNVTLKCDVLHVRWYLALTSWEFNETYIPQEQESSRYHQSLVMFEYNMTMVLDILNVSQRDEGRYDCNVYAAAGDKSANITLIVNRKGKFVCPVRPCMACNSILTDFLLSID